MMNYNTLIMKSLQGDTPKEKYDWLMRIKSVLISIGYPRRGTEEESMDYDDVAQLVQSNCSLEDLQYE